MSNEEKAKLSVQRGKARPQPAFQQSAGARYRIRYTKLGRASFIAHLDTMRLLMRMLRRAGLDLIYTQGFHPKPDMSFGPALGLSVLSLGEVVDLRIEKIDGAPAIGSLVTEETLRQRLQEAAPEGVRIDAMTRLPDGAPGLSRLIEAAEWAIGVPRPLTEAESVLVHTWRERPLVVYRKGKGQKGSGSEDRAVDAQRFLLRAEVNPGASSDPAGLREQLEWPAGSTLITAAVRIAGDGGVRPVELAEALLGSAPPDGTRYARLSLLGPGGIDLCSAEALRPKAPTKPAPAEPANELIVTV
jgi:radical SAM-linked protein